MRPLSWLRRGRWLWEALFGDRQPPFLGVNHTLIGGAVLLFISLILAIPLSINFTEKLELDPGHGD